MVARIVNKSRITGTLDLNDAMTYFGGKSIALVEDKIMSCLKKKKWHREIYIITAD